MSQPLLKVVPLPEKRIFETNNSIITGLSQSGTYLPNGNYTLSCSSSSNVDRNAYHAFNNNKNYWESNYKGNPSYNTLNSSYPDYTQSAYTGRYPSAYRGGGKKGNTFITKIGLDQNINKVKGEWLQIKIPYQIYLKSYSIEVPSSSRSNGFPKEFIVAGSNDGDNWEALHTKTMPSEFNGTKQQFEFVYPKKFSHFRLIITKLQGPLEKVQISNWSLFGNTILLSNQETNQESFVSLGRCLDCTRNTENSSIGGYAPYVEGFDNYTYTSELRQKYPLPESEKKQEGFSFFSRAKIEKKLKQQEDKKNALLETEKKNNAERKRRENAERKRRENAERQRRENAERKRRENAERKRKQEEQERKRKQEEQERKRKEAEEKLMYNRYAKAVEEEQINPLQKKAAKYENDVKDITINHQNISNTLNSITNANQTGLLDELKKESSYKNSIKMHSVGSTEDARLKDIEHMINTNNEIYVLGGIATATLLIFSGMLWMKQ